ncbi:kinesin-like protein KIN-7E [Durio zibethinus]|uniref:Kinesin-like protein n=1 Tax=Durio zibethinus TaxID=66656 RepID=A0A6P6AE46_DURZI|nr:kinesin-like protein KIN-7E [Durio zibethinus]XP_022763152.1 kinesin-like protein KIN-7E [Durio zibethinus]XP_022763153.1 kinesin-like protein KIN-7E [Durio zibethinus]XP_022763154.1 kinesin-like protein KIN-7E [Durio zibethinus]XP_022763155.1 kinesin-like protein KIN-7E [Durio zibethinus]XP_022763156.1 kinesin-like protein KIN-7E [Durio zibethinus]XP_022763158.1 kinesin-like protein KIN-7E [Durio zibethinus]XP_022763159.1 kinesin-like protein KIN-7E [Durio zibethinus]XP_022763160.1 kine
MGAIGGEELKKLEKEQKAQMAIAREERILVVVRLRPLSDKEIVADEVTDWECINDSTILYRNTLREGSTFPSAYTFDRVFRGDCSTKQVYEEGTKEIALSVVSGINSSIFAYGQTSSGKTYTMTGITENTVADIFEYINRHEERAFVLKFSAIEIYNEAIRDLLSSDNTQLRLRDDPEKGTIVEKVTEEPLRDWNHLKELLAICEAQRRIGETSLNERSSRSHQIIRLTIESSAREFLGKENSTTLAASVNFIDLAGSERASQSLSTGARLKEGCHINRSLLTLSTVIRKLSKGRQGHINYRDSKLTRILQPCLGGNARTAIICTLSPARSHVEQTRNTLLFACCAKEVTTKAQVNVVMSDKALVKHLQREVARLESELRSPVPPSSNSDYAALLRKKDLQIQKMEKEIRELTKQRDLAQSRVEDLLRMIGNDQDSGQSTRINYHPNQQAGDAWVDDYSASESSCLANSNRFDVRVRKFNSINCYDTESGSNLEEPYHEPLNNHEDHSMSDSGQSRDETPAETADDPDEYCKEVQCIEIEESGRDNNSESRALPNGESEGPLALTLYGDDGLAGQETMSTPMNGIREADHIQNGFRYDALEQRLHHVQKTIDSLVSPYPDKSSPDSWVADLSSSRSLKLNRSWSCRADVMGGTSSPYADRGLIESTPPNGLEKNFPGRPEGYQKKFPSLNYGDKNGVLTRNNSESSLGSASVKTSADEDITSIHTFVAGLKKQLANGQVQGTGLEADESGKSMKDVGLDPTHEASGTPLDWRLEFERLQKAILELWQTCNVSMVHRTYFFLLFKGDPTDSIYMEVELRRLAFLKETFSQGNQAVEDGRTLTLASSVRALHRERQTLSKLLRKRFTEGERQKLYQKWGIELNSKQRRLQLVNQLWSNNKDMNHIMESATIVAKLIRFVEQGRALKEMFGLSFTPPRPRRRSFGWKNSMASLL